MILEERKAPINFLKKDSVTITISKNKVNQYLSCKCKEKYQLKPIA
jgi:hypothetical protein